MQATIDTIVDPVIDFYENKYVKLFVYAVIIFLFIFVVLPIVMDWVRGEGYRGIHGYLGDGYGAFPDHSSQALSSGASLRRLGQEDSATNRGDYSVLHNKEDAGHRDFVDDYEFEQLVGDRRAANLWEIDSDLDEYQRSQARAFSPSLIDENPMIERDQIHTRQEDALANLMYR